jgi:hypothetical protein
VIKLGDIHITSNSEDIAFMPDPRGGPPLDKRATLVVFVGRHAETGELGWQSDDDMRLGRIFYLTVEECADLLDLLDCPRVYA